MALEKLTGWGIWEHSNFDKNAVPKVVRPLNGMSAWTATVFPGMLLSSGPDCTIVRFASY